MIVKLCDLGLSTEMQFDKTHMDTKKQTSLLYDGTPSYIAPEGNISKRSDVLAWGMTAVWILRKVVYEQNFEFMNKVKTALAEFSSRSASPYQRNMVLNITNAVEKDKANRAFADQILYELAMQ
jgi:serine/threonine protein kinase